MEENDATFESDSEGNTKVNEGPLGANAEKDEKGNLKSVDFFEITDDGKGRSETESPGSGKIPLELPDVESTGKTPTQNGEPLTFEAGDALNGYGGSGGSSSGKGGPRVDENRAGRQPGAPSRRVYNNIGELEKEVEEEQKNIKEIVGNLVKKCKEQQEALQGKINQAGSKHNGLATGVFGKLPPVPPVPSPVPRPVPPGAGQEPRTPPNAPLGQKVRRTYFHLEFAKVNAPPVSKPLVDIAQKTFDKADQLCTVGDLENGNQALETADELTKAALSSDLQPSPPGSPAPPGSDSETEQRANAQNTGLDLCRAANSLNDAGFPNLASSLRITAGDLLNFGLGLARSSKLLDLPLNLVEAFAGQTIEFNESGELVIREATTTERVFAVLDVALTIGVLATGGLPALLGAGVLGAIDKETAKKLEKIVEGFRDKARRGESFDIPEFPGYRDGIPKPTASPKMRVGTEYKEARKEANRANRPLRVKGKEVHEILPVKFGGSPTDSANKVILSKEAHIQVTVWWRMLQRLIEGK